MNTNQTLYKKLRAQGLTAIQAKNGARTIIDFGIQETISQNVKIEAIPEENNYFDVYGEPDTERERRQIIDSIERDGMWIVYSQVKCPCCGKWETVDSIGMIIDPDPTNPLSNPYVIYLMNAALDKIESQRQ